MPELLSRVKNRHRSHCGNIGNRSSSDFGSWRLKLPRSLPSSGKPDPMGFVHASGSIDPRTVMCKVLASFRAGNLAALTRGTARHSSSSSHPAHARIRQHCDFTSSRHRTLPSSTSPSSLRRAAPRRAERNRTVPAFSTVCIG